ncbi:hypothetical protein Tco_0693904 [Tanacetum coccineum]
MFLPMIWISGLGSWYTFRLRFGCYGLRDLDRGIRSVLDLVVMDEYIYACSDSLLLTQLCCDDIHEVTPRASALVGYDRLVSEPGYREVELQRNEFAPHRLPQREGNMNGWLIEEEDEPLEYEAPVKEVESDLESTASSKPKLKKSVKAISDRTFRNCSYCSK